MNKYLFAVKESDFQKKETSLVTPNELTLSKVNAARVRYF